MSRIPSSSAFIVPHDRNGISSVRDKGSRLSLRFNNISRSFSDSQLRKSSRPSGPLYTESRASARREELTYENEPDDENEVHADEPMHYTPKTKSSVKEEGVYDTYVRSRTIVSPERMKQLKLLTKCMLAYTIACSASLTPLAHLFHPSQSQHMVATAAVYFSPARTIGGMIEANAYGIVAFLFALAVGLASMGTVLYFNSIQLILIGHLITLMVWVGGSMGLIAYAKDYKSQPTFSTACSLTTIIIFLVVVKEGAVHIGIFDMERIFDVAAVVACGCIVSDLICLILWPSRAAVKASIDIEHLRISFAETLTELPLVLTRPEALVGQALQVQSNRRNGLLQNLYKTLQEVSWESRRCSVRYQVIFASVYRLQQYCSALGKISLHNQGLGGQFSLSISSPLAVLQELCSSALRDTALREAPDGAISAAIRKLQDESRAALARLEDSYGLEGIPTSELQDQIFPIVHFIFEYCEACEEVIAILRAVHPLGHESVDPKKQNRWILNEHTDRLLPPQVLNEENLTTPSFKYRLWQIGTFLKSDRVKYAIKTGFGAAVLAAPAFFSATRPTFHDLRAEWSLVSYMIVSSPTSGTTSLLALQRVIGTALGSLLAFAVWQVSGNPIWLGVAGSFVAAPCFWAMLFTTYSSGGRFALLAYNISALYTFNAQDRVHIGHICLARFVTVIAGVLWATVVNNVIWRRQSRKVLRSNITSYLLALGFFYRQLLLHVPMRMPSQASFSIDQEDTERTPLVPKFTQFLNVSDVTVLRLQLFLTKTKAVLAEARNEPRLRGTFSAEDYNVVLRRLQDITEHLILMRGALTKSRRAQLASTDTSDLVHLVMNLVWTLSAAFRSKIPLPPTLTDASTLHRKLLQSILDQSKGRSLSDLNTFAAASFLSQSQEIVESLEDIEDVAIHLFGMYAESEEYLTVDILT